LGGFRQAAKVGVLAVRPIDVILKAAVEASWDLDEWRAGEWSNEDRNEQWVHSYVAIRLNDYARQKARQRNSVLVTLESKVSWLDVHCNANPRRGRPSLTGRQRFDLAVWNGDYIEGLVEVKNAPRTHDDVFTKDLQRLRAAIRRWGAECGGTLRWGAFLFSATVRKGGNRVPKIAVEEELQRRLQQCGVGKDAALIGNSAVVAEADDCHLGWGVVQATA
jgi:hypothetical protein